MYESTVREDLVPTSAEKTLATAAAEGVELVDLGAPVVADPDRIVTASQIADGAEAIAAQPDVPRNLTGLLVDSNDSVTSTVTITGLAMDGVEISEVMSIAAGVGKSFTGTKIFASVTSVVVSGTSGSAAGDNLTIGVGDVIGLPKRIDNAGAVKYVSLGAVPVTADAIATGLRTSGVDANGATYDGSKVLRCAFKPGT